MIIADTKRKEKALQQKSKPYLEVILTGENNDPYENLDKIVFPTYVTYEQFGAFRQGIINRSAADGRIYFFDTTRQWGNSNFQGNYEKMEELMDRFPFQVCKTKLIMKRG